MPLRAMRMFTFVGALVLLAVRVVPSLSVQAKTTFAGQSTTVTTLSSSSNPTTVAADVEFRATAASSEPDRASWRIVSPGLPVGVQPTSMWGRGPDNMFVYGSGQVSNGALPESHLSKWDGQTWREVLFLPNTVSLSVFGTAPSDVFVSAYYQPNGPAVVYRSSDDGNTWTQQTC